MNFEPTKRVMKKHVGRPMDFLGHDGKIYNGRVVSIRRGFAEVLYHVPGEDGEFRAIPRVTEKRVQVY